jgi:hypothetical protein
VTLSVVGGIVWFMLVYSLTTAFEDVSLVVRSGVVLDRTTAGAARPACLPTLVRAGRVAGLPTTRNAGRADTQRPGSWRPCVMPVRHR